eukprot:scaffold56770_cov34-Cyclotella_meneghiniana.AAC.1
MLRSRIVGTLPELQEVDETVLWCEIAHPDEAAAGVDGCHPPRDGENGVPPLDVRLGDATALRKPKLGDKGRFVGPGDGEGVFVDGSGGDSGH